MKKKHGMVLGKFYPPHNGHKYLIEMASNLVDELTVVVGSLPSESIPGELRFEWMQEMCHRKINVVHLHKDLPQHPDEHANFWSIWKEELIKILPNPTDVVFASEEYGWKLADVIDAEFYPIDINRVAVPISATQIRNSVVKNFDFIARPARPYFTKRVCIIGPESTGKSTLCELLAKEFSTSWVPEYARSLIEAKKGEINESDMLKIAKAQIASEDILAKDSNGVLICDTDILTTKLWSQELFGVSSPELDNLAMRNYDLTLLLNVDVPWVDDVVRFSPENRDVFYKRFIKNLELRKRPFTEIRGNWESRFKQARNEILNAFDL